GRTGTAAQRRNAPAQAKIRGRKVAGRAELLFQGTAREAEPAGAELDDVHPARGRRGRRDVDLSSARRRVLAVDARRDQRQGPGAGSGADGGKHSPGRPRDPRQNYRGDFATLHGSGVTARRYSFSRRGIGGTSSSGTSRAFTSDLSASGAFST